jgi:hypothetical protein
MLFVDFAKAFGNENGVGLPDDVLPWITEQLLGAGINKQDGPRVVDDDDAFSERLQKGSDRNISLEKSGSKRYLPQDSLRKCSFVVKGSSLGR